MAVNTDPDSESRIHHRHPSKHVNIRQKRVILRAPHRKRLDRFIVSRLFVRAQRGGRERYHGQQVPQAAHQQHHREDLIAPVQQQLQAHIIAPGLLKTQRSFGRTTQVHDLLEVHHDLPEAQGDVEDQHEGQHLRGHFVEDHDEVADGEPRAGRPHRQLHQVEDAGIRREPAEVGHEDCGGPYGNENAGKRNQCTGRLLSTDSILKFCCRDCNSLIWTRNIALYAEFCQNLLYFPVLLSHFSPAPMKTDRAIRIQ